MMYCNRLRQVLTCQAGRNPAQLFLTSFIFLFVFLLGARAQKESAVDPVAKHGKAAVLFRADGITRTDRVHAAENAVVEFLEQQGAVQELFRMFPGAQTALTADWAERATSAVKAIVEGRAGKILLDVRPAVELSHTWASFTPKGKDGRPVIFLSEEVLNRTSAEELKRILIEELGHWLDYEINGEMDSPGDEGQLFAEQVMYGQLPEHFRKELLQENDFLKIAIDGVVYNTELASLLFSTSAAYEVWSNSTTNTTTLETNSIYVKSRIGVAGDRVLFISIPEEDPVFSGNNTRGWVYIVAPDNTIKSYYLGEISRLFKNGSTVEGLQFYVYPDQSNEGYLADRNTTSTSILIDIRNPDFQVGQTYGTSSDPVAASLNALLAPDPVSAGADAVDGLEKGGLNNATAGSDPTGNILTNDAGGLTTYTVLKTVTPWVMVTNSASVQIADYTSTLNGATSVVPGTIVGLYGTIQLNANGSFTYTIANNNTAVQALRTSSNTLKEIFTYKIVSGSDQGIGTLTLTIKGANDNPVAVNDYNTANAPLDPNTVDWTTETVGSKATGNVLLNDTDVDAGDIKAINPITGSAVITLVATVGNPTFGFTTSTGWASVKTGDFAYILVSGQYRALRNSGGNHITLIKESSVNFRLSEQPTQVYSGTGTAYIAFTPGIVLGDKIGFDAQSNTTVSGNVKNATVATIDNASQTASVEITSVQGVVAAGMEVSGTGVANTTKILKVEYDGSGGPVKVFLDRAITSTIGAILNFTAATGTELTGRYGVLILNSNGTYTYTPNVNPGINNTVLDPFDYTVQDQDFAKSNAVLYITIVGTGSQNPDANPLTGNAIEAGGINNGTAGLDPTANIITSGVTSTLLPVEINAIKTTQESTSTTLTGTTVSYDGVVYDGSVSGLYGILYVQKNGIYKYAVANSNISVQALKSGNDLSDVFLYQVSNGSGSNWSTLTLTVQGAYDAPVAVADVNTALIGVNSPTGNVLSNDTDVDAADTKVVSRVIAGNVSPTLAVAASSTSASNATSVTGTYGTLKIGADGTYIYTVDENNAAVKALASTGSLTEVFTYEVKDGGNLVQTTTLTIILNAPNKAPVNTNPATASVASGSSLALTAANLISVTDVDTNLYGVTVSIDSGTLSFTYNGQNYSGVGTFSFYGTEQDINAALATLVYTPVQGFSGSDKLIIESVDKQGLSHTTSVTITVIATDLTVSSVTVNEKSPYAVFEVGGAAGQQVKLSLASGTATLTTDFGPALEYYDGTKWVAYTAGSFVSLDTDGKLLVRTAIKSDGIYEGSENFTLIATNTANTNFEGTGTIKDDGTGSYWIGDATTPATDVELDAANITLDDDRALTVTSITVNEKSPYAVFEVGGAAGQQVKLSLASGTATLTTDFGPAVEYYDGTKWVAYTANSYVELNASGKLLVRTAIKQDAVYEGSETFKLLATNTGGTAAEGTGTIKDDGTGSYWIGDATTPATTQQLFDAGIELDDDRPKAFPDKNVTTIGVAVNGSVATNDVVTPGTTYGTPVADQKNPAGAQLTMNADGTYTFTATAPGEYLYAVPVCAAGQTTGCLTVVLQITVLDPSSDKNIPVVNADVAVTQESTPVTVNVLANDKAGNLGATLDPASVKIASQPQSGTVTVNADGTIKYTPNDGFIGNDVFSYTVCETGSTTNCQTTEVYITVRPQGTKHQVSASDDYAAMSADPDGRASITGTVLTNDGSTQQNPKLTVSLVSGPGANEGTVALKADGTYTFTPAAGFSGNVEVVYTVCDDAVPASCAKATLHILVVVTDSDGDGVSDLQEIKDGTDPKNPCSYKEASQNLSTVSDAWKALDCDGDGTVNGSDPKPNDPCVDGGNNPTPDVNNLIWQAADCDGDGIPNKVEGIADTDGDGIPNFKDTDSDGDGLSDKDEAGADPTKPRDTDGDGIPDYLDLDSDNDGITDKKESGGNINLDTDKDGIPDHLDLDADGDGIADVIEADGTDANGDGRADGASDPKGIPVSAKGGLAPPDTDQDGKPDFQDVDSDGDGIPDNVEGQGKYVKPSGKDTDGDGLDDAYDSSNGGTYIVPVDTDKDGKPDYRDIDSDGDGIPDKEEAGKDPNNPVDTDGDGVPDYRDLDSDGDGISDKDEYGTTPGKAKDTDGDGIPDHLDIDSDNDGITDIAENGAGPAILDTDKDGIPDYLDLDSDVDGLTDVIEADGTDADKDGRADGAVDSKGVPSSAKGGLVAPDTDKDGKRDFQDIDSDGDSIPDNTEGQGTFVKASGKDTDGDGLDDAYDSSNGGTYIVPVDTDKDGKPDYRDIDSDNDGIPDEDEAGPNPAAPVDTDKDGIPDYREADSDNDGIPDGETLLIYKSATQPILQSDGTFIMKYTIVLQNNRNVPLTNVLVKDDLSRTFPAPVQFKVSDLRATGTLTANASFNGRTVIDLLNSSSTLAGKGIDSIMFTVRVEPNGYSGPARNTGEGSAISKWGPVSRQSIDLSQSNGRRHGAGMPTNTLIPDVKIFIADVLTPNRDGINDTWIIVRPAGVKIGVKVFNRWGQIVFRNDDYQNDWFGLGVGNFLGRELPHGSYFYVVDIINRTNGARDTRKGSLMITRDY